MAALNSSARQPMPAQFCNLDRLLFSMEQRGIDGLVATTANNVFYLSGFSGIAHKSDEPRPYAVILSRHAPTQPILVLADYYVGSMLAQPTWIEDIRSFRAVMMPLDLPAAPDDIDRFVPQPHASRREKLRATHASGLTAACQQALKDLKLSGASVAFDQLRLGQQLGGDGMRVVDGYDPLMAARAIKTAAEIDQLKIATAVNQQAIQATVNAWTEGMSWRELNHRYHQEATALGGFVRDPGAMVWGHPRGADKAITLQSGFEDFEVRAGTNIMFDCHGTVGMYCWDGGKTWTVGGEPEGDAKRFATATAAAAETVMSAMKPGAKISELQTAGRASFRKSGVPDADSALTFFHGLGLSHMDIEQTRADGSANVDWTLEKDMVVPLHILYPGDETHRTWVEEIVQVQNDGGAPFFSWGFGPILNQS